MNGFEESLHTAHVLEDIGLQVAISDENGAPRYVLERLLEGLDYLLHRLVRRLAIQDLKHVLIYHLHFLDVNLLTPRAKCAKRCHRVDICVPNRVRVHLAILASHSSFLSFLLLLLLGLDKLKLLFKDLLGPHDILL